jgi:hypothetical protein
VIRKAHLASFEFEEVLALGLCGIYHNINAKMKYIPIPRKTGKP